MREKRMSGETLTTHASLTMDFVLKLLGGHLHDGDASLCEFVDEFRATRAGDLRSFRLGSGEFALRVPEQSCGQAHLLHELCWVTSEARRVHLPAHRRLSSALYNSSIRAGANGRFCTLKRGAKSAP